MLCSHCGHFNPLENRFCGMCGSTLVSKPAPTAPREAAQDELASARSAPPRPVKEVWSAAEPEAQESRPLPPFEPRRERESAVPEADIHEPFRSSPEPPREESPAFTYDSSEPQGEIHGPSFLGLSDSPTTDYLLEEEDGSHAGRLAFLLVVLAVVAVGAWKWNDIRTYVWTQAVRHSLTSQPATSAPATDAAATPQTGMPQNDSAAPAAKPEMTTAQPNAAGSAQPATTSAAPPDASNEKEKAGDSAAPASPKNPQENSVDSTNKDDKSNSQAASAKQDSGKSNDTASADESPAPEKSVAAMPKRAARKSAPAPQQDQGSELLASGEKYLYGRGVPQSCRQALVYFKAAADHENPGARSHVAAMYATGQCGVRVNRVQAYRWFSKAFELQPSNHYLEENLTMLWRQMTDQERAAVTHSSSGRSGF